MRSRSNAIDGTFANGNQRGRHHDGHAARPLLGQYTYDIAFYVSILTGILALWLEDAVGRRRRDRAPRHQQQRRLHAAHQQRHQHQYGGERLSWSIAVRVAPTITGSWPFMRMNANAMLYQGRVYNKK